MKRLAAIFSTISILAGLIVLGGMAETAGALSNSGGNDLPSGCGTLADNLTCIVWTNGLSVPIVLHVSHVDNYDWEGNLRPDHQLPDGIQDAHIAPGATIREVLHHNGFSNPHFDVQITTLPVNSDLGPYRIELIKNTEWDNAAVWAISNRTPPPWDFLYKKTESGDRLSGRIIWHSSWAVGGPFTSQFIFHPIGDVPIGVQSCFATPDGSAYCPMGQEIRDKATPTPSADYSIPTLGQPHADLLTPDPTPHQSAHTP